MAALKCAYASASGSSVNACHFIGRRWDPKTERDEGRFESKMYRREGIETLGITVLRGTYEQLHRTESGAVWLTTNLGQIVSSANPVRGLTWTQHPGIYATRVWALSDELVFAWAPARKAVHVFDGSAWRSFETPNRIDAVHGASPDLIMAVGWFVGRWNGSGFTPVSVDTERPFHHVHVVSEDEMYAICNRRAIWEGSVYGWAERTTPTEAPDLNHLVKWRGQVWVAHEMDGICTMGDDGALTVVKDNFVHATHMDERGEQLLITTPDFLAGTNDGVKFVGMSHKRLVELFEQRKPTWEVMT